MRSLIEVKENIKALNKDIEDCEEEIKDLQKVCSHPAECVNKKHQDFTRDDMGKENYVGSLVEYTCVLCEGSWANYYDSEIESTPTLEDILKEEYDEG